MSNLDLTKAIEAGARSLAELADGEPWPSNAELGGNPTGTRDDEYRDGLTEQAAEVIAAALPYVLEAYAARAKEEANHWLDGGISQPLTSALYTKSLDIMVWLNARANDARSGVNA